MNLNYESLTDQELLQIEEEVVVSKDAAGSIFSVEKVGRLCQTIRELQRTQDDLVSEGYKMASTIGKLAADNTNLRAKDDPKLATELDNLKNQIKERFK